MVEVRIEMPRDLTFLSNILYEGLLFSLQYSPVEFDGIAIKLPNDFIVKAIRELDDERIANIKVAMSGNDSINRTLFEKYGIKEQSRKTFYDFISKIKEHADSFKVDKNVRIGIELKKSKGKNTMVIDAEDVAAPQLFKVDRYTGITSIEMGYTSQQVTIYASKEVMLIATLGIYSSFVTSVTQQNQRYYFFLTLSPEEIEFLLNSLDNKELVKRIFRTKSNVINVLSGVLNKTTLNELIVLEVYLNAEIRKLMNEMNLDKISLILFKIAPEGQTYKVYESIPITIYEEEIAFHSIVRRYYILDRFLDGISEALNPGSVILDALSNLNKYNEANNVLKAVHGLYRFVVLGNADGWYEFIREITNAYKKLENSTKPKERARSKKYMKIVKLFT